MKEWHSIRIKFINGEVNEEEAGVIRRCDGEWVTIEYASGLTCHWPTLTVVSIHEKELPN